MFFFIPIGHEDSRVKRFPLLSAAVAVACLAAFAHTWPQVMREQQDLSKELVSIYQQASSLASGRGEVGREFTRAVREAGDSTNPNDFLAAIDRAVEKTSSVRWEDELDELRQSVTHAKQILDGRVFIRYGLVGNDPKPLTFITHMFLHGGYLHLIFNLIFFLLVAPALESLWGRLIFPIVYLVSGIAAAEGYLLMSGPSPVPMVGASGAIAGLMGAFLTAFTQTRIKMCGIIIFPFPRVFTFSTPAWVFLPFWAGWEVYQGMGQLGMPGVGGVAHWAHVAGFAFGAAVPFALRLTGLEKTLFPLYTSSHGKQEVRHADPSLSYMHDAAYRKGLRLRDQCDWRGSISTFEELVARYPQAVGARVELAESWKLDGDPHKRREVLIDALELAAKTRDQRLLEIYDAVRADALPMNISPECLFRVGVALERAGQVADAAEHLRRFITQVPDHPLATKAATRLMSVLAGPLNDQKGALAIAEELKKRVKDAGERQEIERQAKELGGSGGPFEPDPAPHGPRIRRTIH